MVQPFYYCSTFYSHRRVLNYEYNLYLKISVNWHLCNATHLQYFTIHVCLFQLSSKCNIKEAGCYLKTSRQHSYYIMCRCLCWKAWTKQRRTYILFIYPWGNRGALIYKNKHKSNYHNNFCLIFTRIQPTSLTQFSKDVSLDTW